MLFIILRLTHTVQLMGYQSDLLTVCQLLALDTISAAIVFHALVTRRAKKG